MLEAVEIETGTNPEASVIWLHGLGADGHDFEPIVPALELPAISIRFVFPHAPMRPVTINAGIVMRAWYDITDPALNREDEAGVRASQKLIEDLMAREKARGTRSGRIVLAGFSQGGAIAMQTGLRHEERIAGIMALSCYLPLGSTLASEAHPANRDVPIFQAHGSEDPIVPLARSLQSRESLRRLGYALEWHEYRMPHAVCEEEVGDIGAWMQRVLA
jgi:phospholipase/carboxylesterase